MNKLDRSRNKHKRIRYNNTLNYLLYKIIRYYETKKEQRKKPLLFYYFCTTKPETPLTKIYSVFAVFKL